MVGSLNYQPVLDWLDGEGRNVHSQFGEDGLIDECLRRLGTTTRHCFEVGAADGEFWSNTLALRQVGWYAVLIESDSRNFAALESVYGFQSTCIHQTCTDLDETLSQTPLDIVPDLGVIDVDGQDWHLWANMESYRPRLLLIEHASNRPDNPVPQKGAKGQAGLTAIRELGRSRATLWRRQLTATHFL